MGSFANNNEATRQRAAMRWLSRLSRRGGWPMRTAIAAPLLSGALLVWQAKLLSELLGEGASSGLSLGAAWPTLALLAGLIGGRALLACLGEIAAVSGAERIKLQLRNAFFTQMLARRPDQTAAGASGALAGALTDQIEALDGFFARFMPAMIAGAFLPLAFAIVVMPVDWVVGLLFLLTAPLIPLFMALVGWGAEAAGNAQAGALSRLSAYFSDRLRGLSTLVLFGRAETEAGAMRAHGEDWRQRTLKVLRIAFLSSAVLEFFAALGVAGVALYVGLTFLGMVEVRGAPLTLQGGLFCLLMAPEVYQPLRTLAAHYHDRAGAKAAVAEIARQFGALPEAPFAPMVMPSMASSPHTAPLGLELCDVSLATPDGSRPLLENSWLVVPAGAHVAILGESGIGKSTLLEALARLRTFSGLIRIGERDLESWNEADLRAALTLIAQRPRVFHGTLTENIRLGAPGASIEAVRRAAECAEVLSFADPLPSGLETLVGEGGLGLSGGEAHRLALARLYLRDPSVVLLDEPTAHLDAQTESRVLDGLMGFARGRTMLVATHSEALAARMDIVFRLEGRHLVRRPQPVQEVAA